MSKRKRGADLEIWKTNRPVAKPGKLRIIGGKFRGRQIEYSGDSRTRPMKDNVREALFNLVGGWVKDKYAFDLFAGTGAIGLEALSREAAHAVLIERHFPTARIIQRNIDELQVADQTTLVTSDTFFWSRKFLAAVEDAPKLPWVVFCSPPYDLFVERTDELMTVLSGLMAAAPPDSLFVVESDERFDTALLPQAEHWKVRYYSPALISVLRLAETE